MKKHIILILIAILSSFQLDAQSPQGFNYQATVRNNAGELLINQNANFQFTIVQGSTTGTSLYVETHTTQTDDLAQVALVIGQGSTVSGDFSQIDWSLGSYYLAIELDTGSGYVSMGTTQFLSVPYALYAESSANVDALQTQINELVLLTDADNDGYSENQGDCDDTNATVYPGATENETDGIDNDCDGEVDETLGYEATFYYLHGGSGTMPYYGDMTVSGMSYYRNDGTTTTSLTDAFADLLVYPAGGTNGPFNAVYPVIETFEFAGPIDGQQGCNPTWTHQTTSSPELYYIAVPKNSAFNVNLVTDGLMEEGCNGQIYNFSSRKEFYIGSENYWLYNIGATSTAALSYGFK